MKKNVDVKSFDAQIDEFVAPILQWQRKKPAKRNTFLLFRDGETGELSIRLMGNKRAKYPIATCLTGLGEAMVDLPVLLGWIKANVRFAEREIKRKNKQSKVQEDGQGNS